MNNIALPEVDTLQATLDLQAYMATLPQLDFPVRHSFSEGVYLREMFMPADSAVVGHRHRHRHAFVLMSGDISIMANGEVLRIQAPHVIDSQAGAKRAIYAHADSTMMTVHVTNETDLDKIRADVIMPDDEIIEGEAP